jgi:hypothetical protein
MSAQGRGFGTDEAEAMCGEKFEENPEIPGTMSRCTGCIKRVRGMKERVTIQGMVLRPSRTFYDGLSATISSSPTSRPHRLIVQSVKLGLLLEESE